MSLSYITDRAVAMVVLLVALMFSAMGGSGFIPNPVDIAPRMPCILCVCVLCVLCLCVCVIPSYLARGTPRVPGSLGDSARTCVLKTISAFGQVSLKVPDQLRDSAPQSGQSRTHSTAEYAGLLFAISNTSATLPGIVGVPLTGWLLDATKSWALTFYLTAALYVAGTVVYLLLAEGTVCIP